jgi:hypothetical protein
MHKVGIRVGVIRLIEKTPRLGVGIERRLNQVLQFNRHPVETR